MISRHYLNKMFEPGFAQNSRTKFSFKHFVSRITKTNFGNFALFVGILKIGENIASPFYAVYMLKYLKFDYLTFTLITIAPLIASLLVMTQWGKISDKFGNKKILSVCALMIAFVPLYWLLFKDPVILFLGEFFISGIFWAGFNLGSGNFIYDTITPEKRTHCVAYFNVFNGTGLFIGAMIGGILATIIPDNSIIFSVGLLWIFLIAFIFRICVFAVFKNRIKEVRTVPEIKDRQIFYDILVDNKVSGFTIDLITTIATTAKKPIKSLEKNLQAIEKGIEEIDKEVEKAVKKTIDTADKIVKRKKAGK
jgi:MFS family permease